VDSEVARTGEAVVTARTDVARTVGLSSTREFTESDTSLVVVDNNCKDGVDSDSEVDCTGENTGTVRMLVDCSVELSSTRVLAESNTSLVVVGSNSTDGVDSNGADSEADTDTEPE
jgi:hypothetical protein